MKSVALFDVDKTIYTKHSFFEIVLDEMNNNIVDKSLWEFIVAEEHKYRTKQQSYETTAKILLTTWAKSLEGQEYDICAKLSSTYFEKSMADFYDYFKTIIPRLKQTHDVYLITANAQFIAESIVKLFQLTGYISTILEVEDGRFTGKISLNLAEGKAHVKNLITTQNYPNSIACGDSENDIEMLSAVEHAICINPTENLESYAKDHQWIITTDAQSINVFEHLLNKSH